MKTTILENHELTAEELRTIAGSGFIAKIIKQELLPDFRKIHSAKDFFHDYLEWEKMGIHVASHFIA